jgi:hypothetical protein
MRDVARDKIRGGLHALAYQNPALTRREESRRGHPHRDGKSVFKDGHEK